MWNTEKHCRGGVLVAYKRPKLKSVVSHPGNQLRFEDGGAYVIKWVHLNASTVNIIIFLNQARSTLLRVKPLWLPWSIIEKIVESTFDFHHDKLDSTVFLGWHSTWQPCGLFCPNHHKSVLSGGTLTSVWPVCDPLGCTGNIPWHLSPSSPTSRKHICRLYWTGYPFGYHVTRCYLLSYGDDESIWYRLRVVSLFPHVSADVPSTWGYIFGTPTAQLVGETAKGPKYVTEVGVTSKAKNKDFFFLLLVVVFQIGE